MLNTIFKWNDRQKYFESLVSTQSQRWQFSIKDTIINYKYKRWLSEVVVGGQTLVKCSYATEIAIKALLVKKLKISPYTYKLYHI